VSETLRVLVVGVTGLIGSAIAARLATLGHAIIGASRGTPKPGLVPMTYVSIDAAHASIRRTGWRISLALMQW
jgi:nucleoside-diphosphate-sugar epimerase